MVSNLIVIIMIIGLLCTFGNTERVFFETIFGTDYETASSIDKLSNKNDFYVVLGSSLGLPGLGDQDIFVGILDGNGTLVKRTLLGASNEDGGEYVSATSDGGFVACGYSRSFGEVIVMLLMKFDENWDLDWYRTIGTEGHTSRCYQVILSETNGDILVTGFSGISSSNVCFLGRFKISGELVWGVGLLSTGSIGDFFCEEVVETREGDLVVVGSVEDGLSTESNTDAMVAKLTSNGELLWVKAIGGGNVDGLKSCTLYQKGGIVSLLASGGTESYSFDGADILIINIEIADGNIVWAKTYGHDGYDSSYSIRGGEEDSESFYVAGTTSCYSAGRNDAIISKFNGSGTAVWQQVFGSKNGTGDVDVFYGMLSLDGHGGVISIGLSYTLAKMEGRRSDILIASLDKNGHGCEKMWKNVSYQLEEMTWESIFQKDITLSTKLVNLTDNLTISTPLLNVISDVPDLNQKIYCGGCQYGFYGEECDKWKCGNIESPSSDVCSGHGECVFPNECECSANTYSGELCGNWYCYEVEKDSDHVCSGEGKCFSPNECECNDRFSGLYCEKKIEVSLWSQPLVIILCSFAFLCVIIACVGGLMIVCVFSIALCVGIMSVICLSILFVRNYQQRRGISKYKKLKNFDILLQEQLIEEDSSIAHLKFKKELFSVNFDDVKVISLIGTGGSNSMVYKAEYYNQIIAFKCFKIPNIQYINNKRNKNERKNIFSEFEKEMEIISSVLHPNIIKYYGSSLRKPRVGILMEYCEKGEILEFYESFKENNGTKYPQMMKIQHALEISSAMSYLHCKNIIHRDLKCENTLIDASERVKLMDFGLSRFIHKASDAKLTKRVGTSFYIAPEIILRDDYDEKCDVFSFGIMLYIILTENPNPFASVTKKNTFGIELKIANDPNFRPDLKELKNCLVSEFRFVLKIVESCWDHDPEKRNSFEKLKKQFSSSVSVTDQK